MDYPWNETREWTPGVWYPVPISQDIVFNGYEKNIPYASWDIQKLTYTKEHQLFGDTTSMGMDLHFLEAVKICNAINPDKLWTADWMDM